MNMNMNTNNGSASSSFMAHAFMMTSQGIRMGMRVPHEYTHEYTYYYLQNPQSQNENGASSLLSSMKRNDDNGDGDGDKSNTGNRNGNSINRNQKSFRSTSTSTSTTTNINPLSLVRKCQPVAAALLTASILCAPSAQLQVSTSASASAEQVRGIQGQNVHVGWWGPQQQQYNKNPFQFEFIQPVNAIEEILAPDGTETGTEIGTINSDDVITSRSTSTTTSTTTNTISTPMVSGSPISTPKAQSARTKLEQSTVIDEVWTLIDKYYLDRSFHDQNWSTVRSQYESKLPIDASTGQYNDDEAMKITTAMVQSLGDKYSRVLDKEQYAKIQKFDLIGVGATLMPDPVDKRIMVGAPPVDGSEAQKGGIKYGDYILAVNGVPTKGRTAFQIIDQISEDDESASANASANSNEGGVGVGGGSSKKITFTVLTEGPDDIRGEGYIRDVTMKRQTMQVKDPITSKITERRPDGTVVGYVRVSEFNSLVEPKLKGALTDLKNAGANAFVLDMRSNPGGAFQSAVEVASLFMEDRLATSVVDSNDVEMPFRTARGKVVLGRDTPLVLWIDGGSASATEVLAGALHDQCRATIMGSNSFGKGLIQAVYGLRNGSGLVLTVAKYVTPNGTDIQGSGITPDLETRLPFLYLPGVSSDTSKVDFNKMAASRAVCPASN